MSITSVSSGQVYSVSFGQSDNNDVVLSGGTIHVLQGSIADTVSGTLNISVRGTDSGTVISGGGSETVPSGRADFGATVLSGSHLVVSLGGTANGGAVVVSSGATDVGALIGGRYGFEVTSSSGLVLSTTVVGGGAFDHLSNGPSVSPQPRKRTSAAIAADDRQFLQQGPTLRSRSSMSTRVTNRSKRRLQPIDLQPAGLRIRGAAFMICRSA